MKTGKKLLMRSLRLLTKFNKLSWKIIFLLILFIGLFLNCEDKIPTQTVDSNILEYSQKEMDAEDMEIRTVISNYNLSSESELYFGEDDNIKSLTIMKFRDFLVLPDTIDEVLDFSLIFYPKESLPVDTSDEDNNYVNIWMVTSPLDWSEDETTFDMDNPLDFENLEKEPVAEQYLIGAQDTCEIDLHESLFYNLMDSATVEAGFVFTGDPANGDNFQSIHSRNTSDHEPRIHFRYVVNDDTTDRTYRATDDLTVTTRKNQAEENDQLLVSQSFNEAVLLNFDLDDLWESPDSNVYIPEARLKLHINRAECIDYNDDFYLYITLLDTADYYADYLYDIASSTNGVKIGVDDSVAVINIRSELQSITTGYNKNLGMILWSAHSSVDMARFNFYGKDAPTSLQPELKVLFVKEEK